MGNVQAAAAFDRLPWLADEPQAAAPRARRARRAWPLWLGSALFSLAAIAAAVYWLGTRATPQPPRPAAAQTYRPPVTVPLPAPIQPPPPQPELAIEPQPEVAPVALPAVPVTRQAPRARRTVARPHARPAPHRPHPAIRTAAADPRPVVRKPSSALPIWPVRAEQNSAGRLVRVGVFATPHQAKLGWVRAMRFYPGMKRLPALVVPILAVPSGRHYYRIQMGTTSQAHSEVLCQRMRTIRVSCVVLDIGTKRR